MTPDVSVLIPCYNAALTLRRAVRSVLNQTGVDVQIVLVDDASADGGATWTIIKQICINRFDKFTILDGGLIALNSEKTRATQHETNKRIAETLNTAANLAQGRYFMRCDSDDWLEPGCLARMVAALDANPEATFCYGQRRYYGRRSDTYIPKPFNADDFNEHNAAGYAYMFRREIWDNGLRWRPLGVFNGAVIDLEDWQHLLAMITSGAKGIALTDTLVLHYTFGFSGTWQELKANESAALAELKARYPTVRAEQL